jgi:hypothetical protein
MHETVDDLLRLLQEVDPTHFAAKAGTDVTSNVLTNDEEASKFS